MYDSNVDPWRDKVSHIGMHNIKNAICAITGNTGHSQNKLHVL